MQRGFWSVFLGSLLAGFAVSVSAQTSAQNAAAFAGGAEITAQSYHWDSVSGVPPSPQVATTPRTVLPGATLTTLAWDPVGQPNFYQEKTIGSQTVQATLVATFTQPFGMWNMPSGTELTLTFDDNGTTNYIMPYVTAGNRLREYLQDNYFSPGDPPTSEEVGLRIQQAVGLPQESAVDRGLAFFWAPLANIARPAYSGDIANQFPTLSTFADGSYETTTVNAPAGFTYVDLNDSTKTYTGANGLSEFVEWNGAQTTYPWTAMGWTYNWNALQDGSDASFGFDPDHVDTPIALSEFIVSGGTQVIAEDWIPFTELDDWVVIPEPGMVWLPIFVFGVVGFRRRARNAR